MNYQGILAIIALVSSVVSYFIKGVVPDWLIGLTASSVGYFFVTQQKKETAQVKMMLMHYQDDRSGFINQWLPFPRCWSHIVLAIICGSIWVLGTGAAILSGLMAYLFVSYQKRQDANCLTQSYLDIREFAVTVAVTVLVMVGLMFACVIPGIYQFTPLWIG